MSIYFLNLFLVIFSASIISLFRTKNKKLMLVLSFIPMYTLLALRAPIVGADTLGYISIFNRTKYFGFWNFNFSRHEPGYILLNKILGFINNEQIFIAIISIIPLIFVFKLIYKESKIPWLSIFLFITMGFYTNTFNLFRQIIALSAITISYKYLKNNDFKKFILSVLIASSFHVTALVFIPIYFFKERKLNYKNYMLYTLMGIAIFLLGEKAIQIMLNLFSSIPYEIESRGGLSLLMVLILVLIAGLVYKRSVLAKNNNAIILYNIMILSIFTQILALKFALFTRVGIYYRFFIILFIPEVIASINDKYARIIGVLLIILLTTFQYYIMLNNDVSSIIPYLFFWE